jgi:pyruvate dehydrogenase phosphatase
MPTRSLGDFRLKIRDFNFHNFEAELGYRRPIPQYTGPYISAEPDIQVIELAKEDRYIVLATDGLWDEISRKSSAKIATELASKP